MKLSGRPALLAIVSAILKGVDKIQSQMASDTTASNKSIVDDADKLLREVESRY